MNLTPSSLLDISQTIASNLFKEISYPWEVLKNLKNFIIQLGNTLPREEYNKIKPGIWIHKTAEIADSACVNAPTIIECRAKIRHCAFIRGSVIIGENCVVGNSTEVKNSILFNNVQVPHFNYVGDSILGFKAHLGAGVILSNVRSDKNEILVINDGKKINTNLKKFGAIIGDFVEIGCNAVLNPGSILGKNVSVYPTTMVRGTIEENMIFKNDGTIINKRQH